MLSKANLLPTSKFDDGDAARPWVHHNEMTFLCKHKFTRMIESCDCLLSYLPFVCYVVTEILTYTIIHVVYVHVHTVCGIYFMQNIFMCRKCLEFTQYNNYGKVKYALCREYAPSFILRVWIHIIFACIMLRPEIQVNTCCNARIDIPAHALCCVVLRCNTRPKYLICTSGHNATQEKYCEPNMHVHRN